MMELFQLTTTQWQFKVEGMLKEYALFYKNTCICEQQKGDITFTCPCEEIRPTFQIRYDHQTYYIKERYLANTGVVNFRDIGGYITTSGRQVRYDCFYRSAPLTGLNENEIAYLNELHIQHILDLRSEIEIQGKEDLPFVDAQYHHISGIHFKQDMDIKGNFDFAQLMQSLDIGSLKQMMLQVYKKLPFDNTAYRFLMDIACKEEVPIVFHCSAGKDRTGFGAALLLLILGVDEETILYDYVLSNVYRKVENDKIYAEVKGNVQDMEALMGVQREYLEASLREIRNTYGTYEEYFKKEYGIDETKRRWLQECYVYPLNM